MSKPSLGTILTNIWQDEMRNHPDMWQTDLGQIVKAPGQSNTTEGTANPKSNTAAPETLPASTVAEKLCGLGARAKDKS